jgi:hypothetical protein
VPLAAVQQGGLLVGRDQLILEPTISYTYSQNTQLILTGFSVLPLIILGGLQSQKTTTNLVAPALQLRYGLYRGLQLDFRVPVVYVNQSQLFALSSTQAGQAEQSQSTFNIGDVNFGLTYQFFYERSWYPDLMFRLGATAPTGQSQFDIFKKIASQGPLTSPDAFQRSLNNNGLATGGGRWSISGTVNAIKALDPGILFGTVGMNYTPASTETLIQINGQPTQGGILLNPTVISARLGAVYAGLASLGLAISLNNQLSVNLSFSDVFQKATTANGFNVPNTQLNIGQFNFGINLAISPSQTLNFVGSIGITPDAPSMSFLFSVPTFFVNVGENTYNLFKNSVRGLFLGTPAPVERAKGGPEGAGAK